MVQSTLVGAMPSQPQKDRNEARVTTSFGSEFSSLHTNLTRYNDNRDITIQISRKRHIAPTSVDCSSHASASSQRFADCAARPQPPSPRGERGRGGEEQKVDFHPPSTVHRALPLACPHLTPCPALPYLPPEGRARPHQARRIHSLLSHLLASCFPSACAWHPLHRCFSF